MAKGAPKGNQNKLKFKTSKERQKVFKDLIEHVENGLSLDCFPPCDRKTIQSYVEKFPIDFPTEKLKEAEREGRRKWEALGGSLAQGKSKGNPTAWIFNMKNRYREDWHDRSEVDHTTGGDKIIMNISPSKNVTGELKNK